MNQDQDKVKGELNPEFVDAKSSGPPQKINTRKRNKRVLNKAYC